MVNCLMASAVRDSPLPLSRWGVDGQLTLVGLKVLRPAPGRRRARRCVCARHAVGGAWCCCWWVSMVRDGPRRAPRAAGRCRCRRRALPRQPPGVMVEEGSGEPPPGGGAIVTPRGRAPAHKDILGRAARVSGRRCEAARHVPGRSREEHHHSLLTVLEQCRRTRSLGAARPPGQAGRGARRLTGPGSCASPPRAGRQEASPLSLLSGMSAWPSWLSSHSAGLPWKGAGAERRYQLEEHARARPKSSAASTMAPTSTPGRDGRRATTRARPRAPGGSPWPRSRGGDDPVSDRAGRPASGGDGAACAAHPRHAAFGVPT